MTPTQLREKAREHAKDAEFLLQYNRTAQYDQALVHASLACYYVLLSTTMTPQTFGVSHDEPSD